MTQRINGVYRGRFQDEKCAFIAFNLPSFEVVWEKITEVSMLFRTLIITLAFFFNMGIALAGDPYTVTNVHVDARESNALAAQTRAISAGYVRAANILIARLSLEDERLAKGFSGVNDVDSKKLIRAQSISNEKRSSTHYVADITVSFNPRAVAQYMHAHRLRLVASQARKRLVIPIIEGAIIAQDNWEQDWSAAWAQGRFDNALTPIALMPPRPDLAHIVQDTHAKQVNIEGLKTIGRAYGVEQILIARLRKTPFGYSALLDDIALDSAKQRRFGPILGADPQQIAELSVTRLENEWKASTVTPASKEIVFMPVSVLYRSHDDWQFLQDVINGTAQIHKAKLHALSGSGAMMTLSYGGDIERLRHELSFKSVQLFSHPDLGMVLARSGYIVRAPRPAPAPGFKSEDG